MSVSTETMAYVTLGILGAALAVIAFAVLAPRRQHDPHAGVAIGCLMVAALPVLAVAALVVIGLVSGVPALVRWPFWGVVVVGAYLLIMLITQLVFAATQRRRWRD